MPDPSPEQPPSWPPTSEPAATPTNPPRITARGVGHLPSTTPEDEPSASERYERPPGGGGLYGDPAQQGGPYGDLDPETRQNEWSGAFGDPAPTTPPDVPQQAGPAYADPQAGTLFAQPQAAPGSASQDTQGAGFQDFTPQTPSPGPQSELGDAADWPPKSSQDWMAQQTQTGWGLSSGGAAWSGTGQPPESTPPPQSPGDQSLRPDAAATPYGASASAPGFDPPTYDAPKLPGQGTGGGSLEFPELRADPYEADVYGQTQYRGDSGGQDLYQSDPYQAERLQDEARQARGQYQTSQQGEPFPPVPQQGSYGEQPGGYGEQPYGSGSDAFAAGAETPPQDPYGAQGAPGGQFGSGSDAFSANAPAAQRDPYAAPASSYSEPSDYGEQSSYGDQQYGDQGFTDPAYSDQGQQSETVTADAVPAQRAGEGSPAAEAPAEPAPNQARVAPPTHRGVRYAIYGIGGLITLGLIIGIVLMLGAEPPREPGGQGDDAGSEGGDNSGADEALTPERYGELAAAAGSEEWFSWRYGEAGENGAEELAQAGGDALATEPLMGDADRSVQGQLGYVTDESNLSGIDHVTAVESTDDSIGIAPRAGGRFSDDGAPELELTEGATADCLNGLGTELGRPVAMARPEQSAEVNAHAVIAFSSGIIATTGISGAQGGTCLQLPAGQVPTDVALTDGNELALVTTWTAESQTGSLVVIALGDKAGSYQSSWSESYPGLPNAGHFAAAEILGTVELPFSAPTSVDAWSNSSGSLTVERGTVADGAGRDDVASASHALIGDLSASQVALVDLGPTLEGLAAQYYDGAEFAFSAAAGDPVAFDGGVADVATTEDGSAVATVDGVVHETDDALAETAATDVGANPTCLVVGSQSGAFIATSRGEAKISWVQGGEVAKELADSRMTDPLCASETPALDAGSYGGTAAVVLVSDYEGQKLHAYLDGEATLPGGATVGGEGFSYGGAYEVAGKPWGSSVTVDLD
ncbi:MAG TPA: hypothetical protein VHG10_13680 [Glycomyces sp.]|nr:hypothetical protein [Glycomyces sp.]